MESLCENQKISQRQEVTNSESEIDILHHSKAVGYLNT